MAPSTSKGDSFIVTVFVMSPQVCSHMVILPHQYRGSIAHAHRFTYFLFGPMLLNLGQSTGRMSSSVEPNITSSYVSSGSERNGEHYYFLVSKLIYRGSYMSVHYISLLLNEFTIII